MHDSMKPYWTTDMEDRAMEPRELVYAMALGAVLVALLLAGLWQLSAWAGYAWGWLM